MHTLYFLFLLVVSFSLRLEAEVVQTKGIENSIRSFSSDSTPYAFSSDSNAVFSPYSLYTCLAMTYAGAENSTREQIGKVLHIDSEDNTTLLQTLQTLNEYLKKSLSINQALCISEDYLLNIDFVTSIQKYLGADLFRVDFSNPQSALEKVNDWVKNNTNGKIEHLLSPHDVSKNSRLILLNALYLKGQWRLPFDSKKTTSIDFTNRNGQIQKVSAMHATEDFRFFEDDEQSIVSLDFTPQNEDIVVDFVLPKNGELFQQIRSSLTGEKMAKITNSMQFHHIELFLPKCTIDLRMELQEILKRMGMIDAFTKKADFSLISKANDLLIDKVIQETRLDVNENGVEAESATAVSMMMKSMRYPEKAKVVSFDRPYYIVIRDKKMSVPLFIGQVIDPLKT